MGGSLDLTRARLYLTGNKRSPVGLSPRQITLPPAQREECLDQLAALPGQLWALENITAQAPELLEEGGFLLTGPEAHMQEVPAQHPDVIEPGLRALQRELRAGPRWPECRLPAGTLRPLRPGWPAPRQPGLWHSRRPGNHWTRAWWW